MDQTEVKTAEKTEASGTKHGFPVREDGFLMIPVTTKVAEGLRFLQNVNGHGPTSRSIEVIIQESAIRGIAYHLDALARAVDGRLSDKLRNLKAIGATIEQRQRCEDDTLELSGKIRQFSESLKH